MGLLTVGTPLSWEETKKLADHVRRHGILQFINIYHKLKDHKKDQLKWGDEVRDEKFLSEKLFLIHCTGFFEKLRRLVQDLD
jgi:hypothetical protein